MTNEEIKQAMEELGLVPEDFLAVKRAGSPVEAREVLGMLQAKARRGFKRAALRLHPDVGGDAALFVQVKGVLDSIEALQVRVPPVRRPVRRVPVMHVTFGSCGTGVASTTYAWNPGVYKVVWTT